MAHAKAYGFVYPCSGIYSGLQGVYDYGPYGVLLKRNVQTLWWKSMVQLQSNIVGLDAAILMHPHTWRASGHLEGFKDWMIDHKGSKKRYRVDELVEAHAALLVRGGQKKAAEELLARLRVLLAEQDATGLHNLIVETGISCPIAGNSDWTAVRPFDLLFSTQVGAVADESSTLYLRPETAQGIFVNYSHVQKTMRMQLPFGIAQIGKAFRNEPVARQFLFRMREFEQMEMQFFVRPGEASRWFDHWQEQRRNWYLGMGIPAQDLVLHPHEQLAHYAEAGVDIQYAFPFGYKEVEGIHSRTDFDLRNHQNLSKKRLAYFDPHQQRSYLPHVVETSAGCDRIVFLLLCHAFKKVSATTQARKRTYLSLPPALAPIKAAILPLVGRDGLPEQAQRLFDALRPNFMVVYESSSSVGKRYARQDLIGTPYCITVDYQTLEDQTVTVRTRDTMQQERVNCDALQKYLDERVNWASLLI